MLEIRNKQGKTSPKYLVKDDWLKFIQKYSLCSDCIHSVICLRTSGDHGLFDPILLGQSSARLLIECKEHQGQIATYSRKVWREFIRKYSLCSKCIHYVICGRTTNSHGLPESVALGRAYVKLMVRCKFLSHESQRQEPVYPVYDLETQQKILRTGHLARMWTLLAINPGVFFSVQEFAERTGLKESTVKIGIRTISELPNVTMVPLTRGTGKPWDKLFALTL